LLNLVISCIYDHVHVTSQQQVVDRWMDRQICFNAWTWFPFSPYRSL